MNTTQIQITRFKGLKSTKPEVQTYLSEVLRDIASDKYKSIIDEVRAGNLGKKDTLPCFTPTGLFNYRSIAGMEKYNGIICLDIDHIEDPKALKESCKNIPWVTAAYITPSGKGLKVIVQTDSDREGFKDTELEIAQLFQEITGSSRDNRCKDIARIQYVSWDPKLYINESPVVFNSPAMIGRKATV